MKIGILTYHFAQNYGAVLQCYALKKTFESLGCQVKILNYVDDNQYNNSSMYHHSRGIKRVAINTVFLPFHFQRKRKYNRFQSFRINELSLTERIKNLNELQGFIKDEKIDAVFVGSDQVWNPYVRDFSDSFFLPFNACCKKFAYAASLGSSDEKAIIKYGRWIDCFDCISVREKTSINTLRAYTEKNIFVVPDPVFLIHQNQWENIANSTLARKKRPYALCYFMNKAYISEYMKMSRKIAKDQDLDIVSLNPNFTIESLRFDCNIDAGPVEFLNILKNADLVLTDSFHGTVFSILFKKNFYSFNIDAVERDTRKTDILKKLGLDSRIISKREDITFSETIFDDIDLKIENLKEDGMTFLRKCINLI